jgi:hypothetical protein
MFIIIPIGLMAISLICVGLILWRKIPYLKKLDVQVASEIHDLPPSWGWKSFAAEMFPEILNLNVNSRLKEYKDIWLSEVEKLLRRLRLMSLKFDHTSDALIKRIRRFNRRSHAVPVALERRTNIDRREEAIASVSPEVKKVSAAPEKKPDPATLKQDEQKIIMEIAKNPKNSKLYSDLAYLYIQMESWNDAKEAVDAAILLDPGNEEFKKWRSLVLEKIQSSK